MIQPVLDESATLPTEHGQIYTVFIVSDSSLLLWKTYELKIISHLLTEWTESLPSIQSKQSLSILENYKNTAKIYVWKLYQRKLFTSSSTPDTLSLTFSPGWTSSVSSS